MTEVEARPLLSGAGGYWRVIDEVAMTMVIQQQDRLCCGPACAEMLLTMAKCGVPIEKHHPEVATEGQNELGFRFATLIEAADYLMTYKYVIKNVAKKYGKTVTFMPKPLFKDNDSGMHTHQSIWKGGKPLPNIKFGYQSNFSECAKA